MSGLIALSTGAAVHVVTDAATTAFKDGALVSISPKQTVTRSGLLIAGTGLWAPCLGFARRADQRDFDELAEIAPQLWEEAKVATVPDVLRHVPCNLIFAGWSRKKNALVMDVLRGDGIRVVDENIFCVGPDDSCLGFIQETISRFVDNIEAFDPVTDGLSYLETLRHKFPNQYRTGRRPAVGGFAQHTELTHDGVRSRILKHWPDRLRRPIELAEDVDIRTTRDPAAIDCLTLAELYAMREHMVHVIARPRPRLTMADVSAVRGVLLSGT